MCETKVGTGESIRKLDTFIYNNYIFTFTYVYMILYTVYYRIVCVNHNYYNLYRCIGSRSLGTYTCMCVCVCIIICVLYHNAWAFPLMW